ncbi:MAG: bifunctional hydroxymethylpyrimidine kinase/phosphomethylpyrimidine kinase [Candidatus Lariskella arthropodorum]
MATASIYYRARQIIQLQIHYFCGSPGIEEQLEAIFDDIRPDSIKIGMLFSAEIIELVASFFKC